MSVWKSNGKYRRVGNYGRYSGTGAQEHKYWDFTFDAGGDGADQSLPNSTSGTFKPLYVNDAGANNESLCLIPAGSDQNSRIGQKVRLLTLDLRINVLLPANTTVGGTAMHDGNVLHLALIMDHQANGTVPDYNEVFQNPTGTTGTDTTNCVDWFRRLDRTGRYTVLWNKSYLCNRAGGGGYSPTAGGYDVHMSEHNCRQMDKHFKLDTIIEYQDSVNEPDGSYSMSKVCCNNLILFAFVRLNNATVGRRVALQGNGRIRYVG